MKIKIKDKCLSLIADLNKKINTQNYIINNCINISTFPKASGIYRKYQIANTKLLSIFDYICKRHNIEYWLDFGTCLGAYRHKGFIPWDDDIDIGMKRNNYNKIINILKSELPEGFLVDEGQSYCDYAITRIIYKNSAIQLDIFPYDTYYKCEVSEYEEQQLEDKISELNHHFYKKYLKNISDKKFFPREELAKMIKKYLLRGNTEIKDGIMLRGLEFNYSHNDKKVYKNNIIYPLSSCEFEGKKFPIPGKIEKFLELNYGNFMDFPLNIDFHRDIQNRVYNIDIDSEIENLDRYINEYIDKGV